MEREYQALKNRWLAGERDRDLGLHLMFFAWMHWSDPIAVTGFVDDPDAPKLWHAVFTHFGGDAASDVEFLFVAGLMASLFSYALGDEAMWSERGSRMTRQAMTAPIKLSRQTFENRGEYGKYFAHQLNGRLREGGSQCGVQPASS